MLRVASLMRGAADSPSGESKRLSARSIGSWVEIGAESCAKADLGSMGNWERYRQRGERGAAGGPAPPISGDGRPRPPQPGFELRHNGKQQVERRFGFFGRHRQRRSDPQNAAGQ